MACNKDKKGDFQVLQNDALRFCNKNRINDRVSLEILHSKANLVSLEQRKCIQLLSLMFKASKNNDNRTIGVRATRQQDNINMYFEWIKKIGTRR